MVKLTEAQRDFLTILSRHNGTPVSRALLPLADREQDSVRQALKRLGLAEYVGGWVGERREPMRWRITPAGRALLNEASNAE